MCELRFTDHFCPILYSKTFNNTTITTKPTLRVYHEEWAMRTTSLTRPEQRLTPYSGCKKLEVHVFFICDSPFFELQKRGFRIIHQNSRMVPPLRFLSRCQKTWKFFVTKSPKIRKVWNFFPKRSPLDSSKNVRVKVHWSLLPYAML